MTEKYIRSVVRYLKRQVNNWWEYLRLRLFGDDRETLQQPNAEYYVISYPKSGRTWLRLMIGKYIAELYCSENEDLLETYELSSKLGLPKIAFIHDGSSYYGTSYSGVNLRASRLKKSKQRFRKKNIILLVRDPRDVTISYYFQCNKRKELFRGTISDFINDDRYGVYKNIVFLNIWARNINVPTKFHLVRYEDMQKDAYLELTKILKFLGVEIKTDLVKSVINFTSFDEMRKMEMAAVYKRSRLKPGNVDDPESFKVRKGKVGNYISYLSQEDIRYVDDLIRDELSPFFGYS